MEPTVPDIKILYLKNAFKEERNVSGRIELVAAFQEPIVLKPKERAIIPTGGGFGTSIRVGSPNPFFTVNGDGTWRYRSQQPWDN